jgi:hypothetical protein
MADRVRVELRRSGGFAGRTVHVRLDSEQMPPAEAARLIHLVSSIDLEQLGDATSPAPRGGADLISYDLTVERGPHRWHGTLTDPSVPSALRPLLQFLTAH